MSSEQRARLNPKCSGKKMWHFPRHSQIFSDTDTQQAYMCMQSTHPKSMFPAEVTQGDTLLSCFSSCTAHKEPFYGLLSVMLCTWLCFSWFCFQKMTPKHSAKVLSGVSKHENAGHTLQRQYPLSEFYSGKSCSADGLESNVNKTIIYRK